MLINDPGRLNGVKVIGVDEHVWRHTRRGDKYVTVIIDLTPVRAGTGPARLLDMIPGRSKAAFKAWLTQRPQAWPLGFRNLTNYIARSLLETGGFRPRLHPALVKSRSSWGSAKDTTETGNQ